MHHFLKSIGFSKVADIDEWERLLQDVLLHYDYKKVVGRENGRSFVEISKEYAPDIGITVCGEYNRENLFRMEYYFPYFRSAQITTYDHIDIESHIRTSSYVAACDDSRVGTTLIFYLSNAAEYMDAAQGRMTHDGEAAVSLSALADTGAILLPVIKDQKKARIDSKTLEQQNSILEAAQQGDEEAIENLTMQDIDDYAMISRRIQHEDVYTIVDSYLIPYGLECDLYNIMGDITDCNIVRNAVTGETVVQLGLNCNDIPLDVCINQQDLMGEPAVGRRFKGIVWLQGSVGVPV